MKQKPNAAIARHTSEDAIMATAKKKARKAVKRVTVRKTVSKKRAVRKAAPKPVAKKRVYKRRVVEVTPSVLLPEPELTEEVAGPDRGEKRSHPALYLTSLDSSLNRSRDRLEEDLTEFGPSDVMASEVLERLFPRGVNVAGAEGLRHLSIAMKVVDNLSRYAASGTNSAEAVRNLLDSTVALDACHKDAADRRASFEWMANQAA